MRLEENASRVARSRETPLRHVACCDRIAVDMSGFVEAAEFCHFTPSPLFSFTCAQSAVVNALPLPAPPGLRLALHAVRLRRKRTSYHIDIVHTTSSMRRQVPVAGRPAVPPGPRPPFRRMATIHARLKSSTRTPTWRCRPGQHQCPRGWAGGCGWVLGCMAGSHWPTHVLGWLPTGPVLVPSRAATIIRPVGTVQLATRIHAHAGGASRMPREIA